VACATNLHHLAVCAVVLHGPIKSKCLAQLK
jgi:hypothetical protein